MTFDERLKAAEKSAMFAGAEAMGIPRELVGREEKRGRSQPSIIKILRATEGRDIPKEYFCAAVKAPRKTDLDTYVNAEAWRRADAEEARIKYGLPDTAQYRQNAWDRWGWYIPGQGEATVMKFQGDGEVIWTPVTLNERGLA